VLGPAKAAAFTLHDEVPKGVSGGIDQTLALQIAAVGRGMASARSPVKGIQRIESIAQFAGETADRRRLLLADLIFKDVLSCFRAHHDHPVRGRCRLKATVQSPVLSRDAPPWRGASTPPERTRRAARRLLV
jgi:hypothetical protein